jgi:hypothetical protein
MLIYIRNLWVPAITIFPFIFMRAGEYSKVTYNHEYIHICQMKETLVIGAYLIYAIELLVKFLYYGSFTKARLNVSFEREAKRNERIIGYCGWRKNYAWIKYIYVK